MFYEYKTLKTDQTYTFDSVKLKKWDLLTVNKEIKQIKFTTVTNQSQCLDQTHKFIPLGLGMVKLQHSCPQENPYIIFNNVKTFFLLINLPLNLSPSSCYPSSADMFKL